MKNRYFKVYSTTNKVAALSFLFTMLAIIAAGVYGWVMNIVHLIGASSITGLVVARVIGIFIPIIGAALGYVG